jgi:chromosome partitioning protein
MTAWRVEPMHVIVLASQKGGTGKTTLSGHLAVQAERAGFGPIALLDTDPQAGLSAWWNERQTPTPVFAKIEGSLSKTLSGLAELGVRLAIIDTPPALGKSILATLVQADLVLIPCQPSPHDLRAIGGTIDLVREASKAMVFVVNRTKKRTRLTADAAIALSQYGTVAPVMVEDRLDFRTAMINGQTAVELGPMGKAAEEVASLWRYLAEKLEIQRVAA